MNRNLIRAAATLLALVIVLGIGTLLVPLVSAPTGAALRIGGPFQLIGGDGRAVTDVQFRGKWMLVYFGYTHCPDACPTALQDMTQALDMLSPAARTGVVPVFITVDPERDTPSVMKDYVTAFGDTIVPLSGSQDAITQAEAEYHVYAAKHPTQDGDYEMDHSSIIYVMNPEGRFVANFTHDSSPDQMVAKLKQLGV